MNQQPDKIRVRITGCSKPTFWYSNYIREEFEVWENEGCYYLIRDEQGRFILKSDCIIVPEEDGIIKQGEGKEERLINGDLTLIELALDYYNANHLVNQFQLAKVKNILNSMCSITVTSATVNKEKREAEFVLEVEDDPDLKEHAERLKAVKEKLSQTESGRLALSFLPKEQPEVQQTQAKKKFYCFDKDSGNNMYDCNDQCRGCYEHTRGTLEPPKEQTKAEYKCPGCKSTNLVATTKNDTHLICQDCRQYFSKEAGEQTKAGETAKMQEVEYDTQELYEDAEQAMLRLLPPDEFGEDEDCDLLHYGLTELKNKAIKYAAALSASESKVKELEGEKKYLIRSRYSMKRNLAQANKNIREKDKKIAELADQVNTLTRHLNEAGYGLSRGLD